LLLKWPSFLSILAALLFFLNIWWLLKVRISWIWIHAIL
jgi:hypothetical protein